MSHRYMQDKKDGQQNIRRIHLSEKMQRSFNTMKRSIQKIAASSSSAQAHYVSVENMQEEEKHLPYVLPDGLAFLTKETGFSKDEIRKLYRAFKEYCPRGTATTNDIRPAYAKLFPFGDSGKYAQIVFNSFDKNRDGVVTFGDLLAGAALTINGDMEEKLSWIFRLYDLNGDGLITKREMLDIISAIYEMVHSGQIIQRMVNRHVDRLFQKMDIDKDGVISREEFMSTCKNDTVIHDQLIEFNHFL